MLDISPITEFGKEIPVGKLLSALREMEDEDPSLSVIYNEATGAVDLNVMGGIQCAVTRASFTRKAQPP